MDISKNSHIDLLYLTNPNFKIKYNKKKESLVKAEEVKFYRKRILQTTKDYLRGSKLTEEINNIFEEYSNLLIQHYKFTDKRELIQQDYKNLPKKKIKKPKNIKLWKENELMMKTNVVTKKTIEDFIPVIVKERRKKKIIIPKQKNFDLKNPKNRKVGLKKENLNNLYQCQKKQERKKLQKEEEKQ